MDFCTRICRLGLICFFLSMIVLGQTRQDETPLTNPSIIQMIKGGLSDDLILLKIMSSNTAFNLATDDLVVLKAAGVSEKVLSAMLDRQKAQQKPSGETRSIPVAPTQTPPKLTKEPTPEPVKDLGQLVPFPDTSQVIWVLLEDVTSFNKGPGSDFWLQLYSGVGSPQDQLPPGTKLHAVITGATKAGRFYRVGELTFYFTAIVFADGRAIPLSPEPFDWQLGKLKKMKKGGPKIDTNERLSEGKPTVAVRGFWSFKKGKLTKSPKDRIAVEELNGATSAQGASLKMGHAAGAMTGSLAGMFAKMPDAGAYAGTGIVLQFAQLNVPRK